MNGGYPTNHRQHTFMLKPEIPINEAARLQALQALKILDTPPEERFDRLTRIAQHALQVPIVLISLVDEDRQWFKSHQGLDATEIPRFISFCGHAILGAEVFCIPDAMTDERFSDNPLVSGALGIRFYAGAPLELQNGYRVGTLCAIDMQPRQMSSEQLAMLRDLARCVTDELQQRPATEVLRSHGTFLYTILESISDAIITINPAGNILSFNRAAESTFGYAAAEVIGQNVKMLMPEPYHSEHDGYISNYLGSGQAKIINTSREVTRLCKNGESFPTELMVTETMLEGERMFIGVARDITARKQKDEQDKEFRN